MSTSNGVRLDVNVMARGCDRSTCKRTTHFAVPLVCKNHNEVSFTLTSISRSSRLDLLRYILLALDEHENKHESRCFNIATLVSKFTTVNEWLEGGQSWLLPKLRYYRCLLFIHASACAHRCLSQRWQRGGNASNSCTVLSLLGAPCAFMGSLAPGHVAE